MIVCQFFHLDIQLNAVENKSHHNFVEACFEVNNRVRCIIVIFIINIDYVSLIAVKDEMRNSCNNAAHYL